MTDRVAVRDTVLPTGGGPDGKSPIFVAKGQVVAMVLWAMHRDTGLWGDDALEFKPERWEHYSKSEGKHVAFGKGPRMCPGRKSYPYYTTERLVIHREADYRVFRKSGAYRSCVHCCEDVANLQDIGDKRLRAIPREIHGLFVFGHRHSDCLDFLNWMRVDSCSNSV